MLFRYNDPPVPLLVGPASPPPGWWPWFGSLWHPQHSTRSLAHRTGSQSRLSEEKSRGLTEALSAVTDLLGREVHRGTAAGADSGVQHGGLHDDSAVSGALPASRRSAPTASSRLRKRPPLVFSV